MKLYKTLEDVKFSMGRTEFMLPKGYLVEKDFHLNNENKAYFKLKGIYENLSIFIQLDKVKEVFK